MSGVATFDGEPPSGTINLGIGQPSADLLPLELLQQASAAFFATAQPLEMNYGVMQGDERFLHSLAGFLSKHYGVATDADQLFVTAGNSQALDLVSTVFANAGDTVFVEEPSYFLAFQIFRDHDLNIVGIPVDDEGIRIDALERALSQYRPAFLYTIPSFHNPGGQSTTESRRQQVVELAREQDFLIVADEVYQLLWYFEPPPPAYGTMLDADRVLSLGSFSKILAPGLRLGWIQTSGPVRQRLLANGLINSGGSLNHFSSHIARQAIVSGALDANVETLRGELKLRLNAMNGALSEHFGELAAWQTPAGGYFFWVQLGEFVDAGQMRQRAPDFDVGMQPGSVFSSQGQFDHCMRLSFAHYDAGDINEGIARLRRLHDAVTANA